MKQNTVDLENKVASKVHVIDGGMGYALFEKGVPRNKFIWSAKALAEPQYHETVIQAHLDFINAGATEIITCNYAVQPVYYKRYFGDSEYQLKIAQHTVIAAKLAREAVTRSGEDIFIFGALPPFCESYRPDLVKQHLEESATVYKSRKILQYFTNLCIIKFKR